MIVRVPERVRAYLLAHKQQLPAVAAAELGITRNSVYDYRSLLVREGALPSRYGRIALADVEEALLDGVPLADVARTHQATTRSLVNRLQRAGSSVHTICHDRVYSAAALFRILGLPVNQHSLRQLKRWRGMGLRMTVQAGPHRPVSVYRITALNLMAFFEQANCPVVVDRIRDSDWRDYASAARAGHLRPVLPAPDVRSSAALHFCADNCGRIVSKHGGRCRSCPQLGNKGGRRPKGINHAAV